MYITLYKQVKSLSYKIYKILQAGPESYTKPLQPTTNEHIVPKHVVQEFTTRKPFYIFVTQTDKIIEKKNTKEVCTRSNEYEMRDVNKKIIFQNLIERDFLAKVEGMLTTPYRKIIEVARKQNNIKTFLRSSNNRYAIMLWMSLITLRSPANIPMFAQACEDVGIVFKEKDKRNAGLSILVNVLPEFAKQSMDIYNIIVLRNNTTLPFVLSSRPAILRLIIQKATNETQYVWTCPIAEDLMLLLIDKEHSLGADGAVLEISINEVDNYNRLLFQDRTVEQFICTQKSALKRYHKVWQGRKVKKIKEKS